MSGSSRASENFDVQSTDSSIALGVDQAPTRDGSREEKPDQVDKVAISGDAVTANGETTSRTSGDQPAVAEGQKPTAERPRRVILKHFEMYKTESRVYIVGSNQTEDRHKILKIDRHYAPNDPVHELHVTEDHMEYSTSEKDALIQMIKDGNKGSGGCQKVLKKFYGIIGFIRFTAGWYAVLVKRREKVAMIGGHYVYQCGEVATISISANAKPDKPYDEARLFNAFQQVDLSKNFYFSPTYDITNTLQVNLFRESGASEPMKKHQPHFKANHAFHEGTLPTNNAERRKKAWGFNDRFIWNHFLLKAAFASTMSQDCDYGGWVMPFIHGFVDQAKIQIFGRPVFFTIIGRRSRHFAGARFLRRGVNDEGNVANDVETEQIVSDGLTTSFHRSSGLDPGRRQPVAQYTSYVQHRGSIPLSWQQDTSVTAMKPKIELHLVDPYHSAAALHFDDLMARYGTPIFVLNLIKAAVGPDERESTLMQPYEECIEYLNQFLPPEAKIQYIPWDMSAQNKASNKKEHDEHAMMRLASIARRILKVTGFFHTGSGQSAVSNGSLGDNGRAAPLVQQGVCRTNCIDCLDRTNAAQFALAKAALELQLHALGLLPEPYLSYENDAIGLFKNNWHDLGDTIAMQYGGSALVNSVDTYMKRSHWQSQSRDKLEGIRRFYSNVALDPDKQNSINLFLGIDTGDAVLASVSTAASLADRLLPAIAAAAVGPVEKKSETAFVGDLEKADDKKPDEADPEDPPRLVRRDYRHWFTEENVSQPIEVEEIEQRLRQGVEHFGDWWQEYYRPTKATVFSDHFMYKLTSTSHFDRREMADLFSGRDEVLAGRDFSGLSPFVKRPDDRSRALGHSVRQWIQPTRKTSQKLRQDEDDDTQTESVEAESLAAKEALPPANTTEGLAMRLMRPSIDISEANEYASYVDQFRTLNLSNELSYESSAQDLKIYHQAVWLARDGVGEGSDSFKVDAATREIYEKHVRITREQNLITRSVHTDASSTFSG